MGELTVRLLPGECWWGGCVNKGHVMPITEETQERFSPVGGGEGDQFAPVYLSSMGRCIVSGRPFDVTAERGVLTCSGYGDIALEEGHENLRGAYLAASRAHFPFTGTIPKEEFFTRPQYNTWIELGAHQTQEGVLRYAEQIVSHGLPAGILMIDGGWQEDYGVFEFHKGKFPEPERMMDRLHGMGFQVMLWVSPIVGSAGWQYKMLRDRGYLIRGQDGEIAIRKWWSGFSAVLDLSNPEAVAWFHSQLDSLMAR